jgi:hypothetical protein
MEARLCPKCGAYWKCDCVIEETVVLAPPSEVLSVDAMICPHDWIEAVGVDMDVEVGGTSRQVLVCRLCGLYAVGEADRT